MLSNKKTLILTLMLTFIFVLAISSAIYAAEKVLVIGEDTSPIVSLDPAKSYEFEGSWAVANVYDKLVRFKPGSASEIEPAIAESWEFSDNIITFTIREGAKFSNGDPVDAEAVAYSLKRVVKLAQAPSWVITQFGITEDSIKAIGNKVQITMDQAYSPSLVLSCMTYGVTGTVNPKIAEEHNVEGDMGMAYLSENSAGSGPYVLVSWERNQKLIFERNKYYWGPKPEIDKIVIVDIPESSSQLLQLKGGTIDVAWNLEQDQIPDIEKTKGLYVLPQSQFRLIYIAMNGQTPPTDNVLVRRAVKSAIDTEAIIKAIGGGVAELHTFIPKGMFAYYDGIEVPYNPEKAKELLAEAGYPDGFEMTLTVPDFLSTEGTVVKSYLEQVGIKTNLEVIAYTTLLGKYRKQGLEMVIARWGADYADPDANAKPFAHCRTTGDEATVKQLAWRNAYANPEMTDMVEKAAFIQDRDEREKVYIDLQKKWQSEGVFKILYQMGIQLGISDRVGNFILNELTQTPWELITLKD
jgi:peptide/nickel transport system substrate-binding protein